MRRGGRREGGVAEEEEEEGVVTFVAHTAFPQVHFVLQLDDGAHFRGGAGRVAKREENMLRVKKSS